MLLLQKLKEKEEETFKYHTACDDHQWVAIKQSRQYIVRRKMRIKIEKENEAKKCGKKEIR